MPSSLAERITKGWYGGAFWLHLLRPLSAVFFLITLVRKFLYQRGFKKSYHSPIPVIVVGNITVGGAGKSPLVSYLVKQLQGLGYAPGVVSRGYGATNDLSEATLVSHDSLPSEVGDEPLMLKRKLNCAVAVSPNRAKAIELLLSQGCDIVVADDGLQHLAMARDIEICVFDSQRLWGNGRLLPSGPLRESLNALKRVDYLVFNGGLPSREIAPLTSWLRAPCIGMHLKPENLVSLSGGESKPLHDFKGQRVNAIAGIGNPERFFNTLESQDILVERFPFVDHHDFQISDFKGLNDEPIIMTEKDAVKCRSLSVDKNINNAWYLPVDAQLDDNLAQQIVADLKESGRLT